ncbi:LLM class flavin-dependent oxidoreductase [Actinospongicola halichondriae]|uniref:LLM class flavin-dependent oxidoreductase n=1 Tax=Actinospongicola halichondriae TaxID=3236844 RepID=UPI003D442E47
MLDLAFVRRDQRPRDAFEASITMARTAETHGFERIWYAEHHNMGSIASSAPAVLIAHVAAHTSTIRLGSGGVMLPNHSPLVIAEQFGTLAELHPDRIDLGLGRAPGTDQVTWRALRRDPAAAERFPQDVLELQGFLRGESLIPGVKAHPGAGTDVPLYILGSSLFGAQLAAHLGLPYAFASHFAPQALREAVARYRHEFKPSDQLAEPYVIAGANAVAADTEADADAELERVIRSRVSRFLVKDRELSSDEVDRLVASPQGQQVVGMMRYTFAGTAPQVADQLREFAVHADADEIMLAFASADVADRVRSIELVAEGIAA